MNDWTQIARYEPHGITDAWQCMVCQRWRPGSAVTVTARPPLHPLPEYFAVRLTEPQTHRVTHCADNSACVAWAMMPGPWAGPPRARA